MSPEFYSRWQKNFSQTMDTLKLPWGGGNERKYGNENDSVDKELTDFVTPKLKWQRVTGKKHLTELVFFQICIYLYTKIHMHTLK